MFPGVHVAMNKGCLPCSAPVHLVCPRMESRSVRLPVRVPGLGEVDIGVTHTNVCKVEVKVLAVMLCPAFFIPPMFFVARLLRSYIHRALRPYWMQDVSAGLNPYLSGALSLSGTESRGP